MSNFTERLESVKLKDGYRELLKSFQYHVWKEDSTFVIEVPKGFKSNGASIPRFLWSVVGHPWGEYEQAAWLHDYMYFKQAFDRKKCDQIFYESMGVLAVAGWKKKVMYAGVRVGGWKGWGKYDKENAKKV